MTLKKRIADDFKKAFKEKNEERKSVLSLVQSEIKNREIELGLKTQNKDLPDEEVLVVLNRGKKQRQDSIENYKKGNREDLVKEEEKELAIIEEYLPQQLSEEELEKSVRKIINEAELNGQENFGQAMGLVMGKLRGQADGGKIKTTVEKVMTE